MNADDKRCILFTGHRMDAPNRAIPRFPAAAEATARALIAEAVLNEIRRYPDSPACAISSGANGGDILFLECCVELGIPVEMYIAMPRPEFIAASVADGGPEWVRRFDQLADSMPVHVIEISSDTDLNVWQQTNLWMLDAAFAISRQRTTVIALWDGDPGDGPGGTTDMTSRANLAGVRIVHLDASGLAQ